MIEVLVWLLFIVIVFGILLWAVTLLPMDAKLQQIARLILVHSVFFGYIPLGASPHFHTPRGC